MGFSTNIYLQANQESGAVVFYKNVGFEKAAQNHVEELPINWQHKVNLTNIPNFYLKFLDNDTNLQEVKARLGQQVLLLTIKQLCIYLF